MPQYPIFFWSSLGTKLGFSNWDTTRSQFPESKYNFYTQEHKNCSPILNKHNSPWSKIPVCCPYHNFFDCANICFLKWLIFWYLYLYQLESCLHKKATCVSQRNLPTNPEKEMNQHQTMKVNNFLERRWECNLNKGSIFRCTQNIIHIFSEGQNMGNLTKAWVYAAAISVTKWMSTGEDSRLVGLCCWNLRPGREGRQLTSLRCAIVAISWWHGG